MCLTRSAPHVLGVRSLLTAGFGCVLLACGSGTGPGEPPVLTCSDASLQTLAVGEFRIVDPSEAGACVRLPAAGPSGAEHLYVGLSSAGRESGEGISAPFTIT